MTGALVAEGTVAGVDIGGTFTDVVVADRRGLRIYKTPSQPSDPAAAFLDGIQALDVPAAARFIHGSTVATNALLERRGARTAFVATGGFRDLLHLARQTRADLYDLEPRGVDPLVPRELCGEAPERVAADGSVLLPLDVVALESELDRLSAAGAESLAIVFLFSFANPVHERIAGELAQSRGLFVSLSSEVLPEYREYERASTTVANAYVAPLMDRYLGELEARLAARGDGSARLRIMQSSGGLLSVAAARRLAVRTALSGPAGGVMGAWHVGRAAGWERLISFDMGGTSTDVCLVDGEPRPSPEGCMISGLPLRAPMLEIHTVGAGGGSLVEVEPGGCLRVGPRSAGADPGPAAYGRSDRPTVTDANLVLGRLDPGAFLGGRMRLDRDRALQAVTGVAAQLGLDAEILAEGVVRVANVQMAGAIRRVSQERGHDPRLFTLVAFGGGGPLHACELAAQTGIPRVLIPRHPGVLSALGMLLAGPGREASRTVMQPVPPNSVVVESVYRELEAEVEHALLEDGAEKDAIELERLCDLRYRGQSYELTTPFPGARGDVLAAALRGAHLQRYGYAPVSAPGELVTLRVRGRAPGFVPSPAPVEPVARRGAPAPTDTVAIRTGGRWVQAAVFSREELEPGDRLAGPALVIQDDATTWLPPGWTGLADGGYNVVCTHDGSEG